MKKKMFKLTVNEDQLAVISNATEMMARLHSGQWKMVIDDAFRYRTKKYWKKMDDMFYIKLEECRQMILPLKQNESWGIMNPEMNKVADTAWDIYQVVRTKLGSEREPFQADKKNKLLSIEEIK